MDVYLTQEVLAHLRALALLSSCRDGLLLGHKQGQRYFVESVLSAPIRLTSVQTKYFQLDQQLGHRILGFFTIQAENTKRESLYQPLFMGKILLEIQTSSGKNPNMKAYVVDFAENFFLSPLKLKKEK